MRALIGGSLIASMTLLVAPAAQAPEAPARPTELALGTGTLAQLREWDHRIDGMLRSGELARRIVGVDTVLGGRTHERYDQLVRGVRVFGGDVARQMRGGVTESIFGRVYERVDVSTTPSIGEDEARRMIAAHAGSELPAGRPVELVVLPRDEGGYGLAWRTHAWSGGRWMHTFLDAQTGAVLLEYDDKQTQSAVGTGTGVLGDRKKISTRPFSGRYVADDQLRPPELVTYDMKGDPLRAEAVLFGAPVFASDFAGDDDNLWTDAANVDAHVHLGWTYDYLFKRFGRKGLDDSDAPIHALTHPVRRSDLFVYGNRYPDFFVNASWCGQCGPNGTGMMLFGEGLPTGYTLDGQYWDYTSGALDIIAHELTHGVTDYSSNLIYRNESGALNESFSDILGTSAEFFYQAPGSGSRQADYLIGEDVITPGGIRSMENPVTYGDPDHYSRLYRGSEDNGGVHSNSGISNQAFYLAIEGGVNRTSGLRVEGVGAANREQIEKVFYRAFVYLLTSSSTFSTARAATIQSARDLYGAGSPAERAVTQAWTAVGVN